MFLKGKFMSDVEKRLNNVEAHIGINQTITRYCRALDWLDESLLRTCYTEDAYCLLYTSPSPRDRG